MGKTIKGKIELKAKKKMRNAMGGMAKKSFENVRKDPSDEEKTSNEETSEEELKVDDPKYTVRERKNARAQLKKLEK
jgi:hypothetical protein